MLAVSRDLILAIDNGAPCATPGHARHVASTAVRSAAALGWIARRRRRCAACTFATI